MDNRVARHQREQQLRDLEVINDKRKIQREQLEQERMAEKAYKKEMYMYQRGLIDTLPDSLNKRLYALQEQNEEEKPENNMLELRAVVKGKFFFFTFLSFQNRL